MPLGVVSNEEFEKELALCEKERPITRRGRNNKPETPEIIREIIAEEAILGDSTHDEIAREFGISTSSVASYKHGATSTATYNRPDEKLAMHNNKIRSKVINTARERLFTALDHITEDKLASAKVRDVSAVAKDMASIIARQEPQIVPFTAQFNFHAPEMKHESEYEVIDVSNA